ncbi:MAG: histidine--tRNA ligase [Candidatus Woesebacteria bacterium]|jgi:histidyl-tRNA synthetase
MANKNIQTLRGFRDYYPKDKAFQNWFYKYAKEVSELFGYREYDGPTLESLNLYAAKSGEELVQKQSFTFKDKGGREVTLRPEMTPTLARMISQKSSKLSFPVRWFSFGRRYRYEKPQKGRGREFYQWDVDILGTENPLADAEIITIAASFYQKIGLTPKEVKIKVNDRKLITQSLKKIGIKKDKIPQILKVIDKKEKLSDKKFKRLLDEVSVSASGQKKMLKLLEDKNIYMESDSLTKIFEIVEKQGLSEYVEFDPGIVRGLDYYTGCVFEGWDVRGKFRALWGGGRYDNLVQDVGGKRKIPGVGFAMGDMVLNQMLKSLKKLPDLSALTTRVLVTIFAPDQLDTSIKIAKLLRSAKIACSLYPDSGVGLSKQLKYADKKDFAYAVIAGPEEVLNDKVTVKDLKTKHQETVPTSALITRVK